MNVLLVLALVAGGLLGLGVALLVWQLVPARPALGPALQRLGHGSQAGYAYEHPAYRTGRLLLDRTVPDADLAVLGRTRTHYLTGVGASALIGLSIAPVLSIAVGWLGWHLPFAIPAAAGVGLAVGAVVLVYRDVRAKGQKTRAEYRRGVAIYLDQVALAAAGGGGPVESLEKAAQVGIGGVFDAIRDALIRASLQQRPPWDELRALGAQLHVPALSDLGEIVATSGGKGAQVYHTLRAKTSSLRDEIRFDDLAEAKKGSTALDAIGAGVVLILLLLVIYPFISRLYTG